MSKQTRSEEEEQEQVVYFRECLTTYIQTQYLLVVELRILETNGVR
jgi:hypothetical protein